MRSQSLKRIAIGCAIGSALLVLAACSKQDDQAGQTSLSTPDARALGLPAADQAPAPDTWSEQAADAGVVSADKAMPQKVVRPQQPKPASPLPVPSPVQLAYRYLVNLELPTETVAPVARSHQRECEAAGPSVCQVLSASENINEDIAAAELVLRAEPRWLAKFRENVLASAKENQGKVVHSNTETEDMSAHMADTQAYLQSRQLLRARLMEKLKSRNADAEALTDLQMQIDALQEEIDTTKNRLSAMQHQVVMANLTISYRSPGAIVTSQTFSGSRSAVQDAVVNFATSLEFLVRLFGFAMPWLLLGGTVFLLVRKLKLSRIKPASAVSQNA